jgi:ribosomal protein S18 acetylase RimI-like enzyme
MALGFVPRSAFMAGIQHGWVFVAEMIYEGLIGFAHYRHRHDAQTTLYEICVHESFRGYGVGQAMLKALLTEAAIQGKEYVRLKAPTDIAANNFYKIFGFTLVGTEGGKKRSLNVWSYPLKSKG